MPPKPGARLPVDWPYITGFDICKMAPEFKKSAFSFDNLSAAASDIPLPLSLNDIPN